VARVIDALAWSHRDDAPVQLVDAVEVPTTLPRLSFWFHLDNEEVVLQFPPSEDRTMNQRCYALPLEGFRELVERAIKRYGRFL
jgi:hypothetical protein